MRFVYLIFNLQIFFGEGFEINYIVIFHFIPRYLSDILVFNYIHIQPFVKFQIMDTSSLFKNGQRSQSYINISGIGKSLFQTEDPLEYNWEI